MATIASIGTINTFLAGNVITAAGHNTNWNTLIAWSTGQIQQDNFGTMTGQVTWSVTTNNLAISSTNTGTEGSVTFAHNGTLAAGKSAVKISSNAAQSAGDAILNLVSTSASSNVPCLQITDSGSSGAALKVVSTTKPSLPAPSMTTTQRNALAGLSEGMQVWNSTAKRLEIYDGTNWVDAGGRTGEIVDFGGASLPGYLLAADGSAVSRTTYAALFAKYSTTWGVGDGSTTFNLPDLRGRATIGDGIGSGLTARTLAANVGAEVLPAHDHGAGSYASSGTTGNENATHNHNMFASGDAAGGASITANPTEQVAAVSTHADDTAYNMRKQNGGSLVGFTYNNNGNHGHSFSGSVTGTSGSTGTGSHGVMQPSAVTKKCVVI